MRRINSKDTLNMLAQNRKQWRGRAVFTFDFNGVPIDFVTLKDAKDILRKQSGAGKK